MNLSVDASTLPETSSTRSALIQVRDEARRLIAAGLQEPLTIRLEPGVHHLTETLVLGPEDSGTVECPVIWTGPENNEAIISGGHPLPDWTLCETLPAGMPANAAGQIYAAPLPPALNKPGSLYDAEGLLQRAETPNLKVLRRDGETDSTTLCFEPGSLPCAVRADMELFLKPTHPWVVNILPVKEVQPESGILKTRIPGTYDLGPLLHQPQSGQLCRLQNVPEGMCEPGRWFVDVEERMLYVWPRNSKPPANIILPGISELIRFEGQETSREWSRNIRLENLTFSHADVYAWPEDRISMQHDWELYEGPTALVRVRNAERIAVRNCRFHHSGGGGVRAEQHAVDLRIENNRFEHLGGSGVALVGHRPGNRDENHHNHILHNHISNVGQIHWHSSGILLCQSGHNHVADNLVHQVPYNGISLVSGRIGFFGSEETGLRDLTCDGRSGTIHWDQLSGCPAAFENRVGFLTCRCNCVEHNEIHHCMERLGDGNGIYISGTGVSNLIRRNWVHDIEGKGCHSGIRLDDMQWHSRVEENLIVRIAGGGITLKDVNDVENNIVVHCTRIGSLLIRRQNSWGSNVRRNIFVQSGLPFTDGGQSQEPPFYDDGGYGGKLEEPTIEDNLFWCTENRDIGQTCLQNMQARGKDTRSVFADPCFVDPDNDDFQLRPESPAFRLGFRPFTCGRRTSD